MPYSTDPKFNQPIRIFHARHGKSLLACLPLAPWRPLQYIHLLPLITLLLLLLLLLSLVSLLDSNCYEIPRNTLYTSTCFYDPAIGDRPRDGNITTIYSILPYSAKSTKSCQVLPGLLPKSHSTPCTC